MNPLEVQAKMRHAKVTITLAVYGNFFPSIDGRLDGLLESTFAEAGDDVSRSRRGLTRGLTRSSGGRDPR
jgi:hypothetical protein